jgi:hypothetical protein
MRKYPREDDLSRATDHAPTAIFAGERDKVFVTLAGQLLSGSQESADALPEQVCSIWKSQTSSTPILKCF